MTTERGTCKEVTYINGLTRDHTRDALTIGPKANTPPSGRKKEMEKKEKKKNSKRKNIKMVG